MFLSLESHKTVTESLQLWMLTNPLVPMLLRPRPKSPAVLDDYLESTCCCDGELKFDSIASKKFGFAWKERLKCKMEILLVNITNCIMK